ncbi:Integral membrane family protein [Apiospora hydei]|uniref:Integral membrane family protein n=1 Tax=Apiospora hydei TaxID=1337664 RepID=A0ABR1VH54_9PEZI
MVYIDGVNLQPGKVPPQLQPNSTSPPPAPLEEYANPHAGVLSASIWCLTMAGAAVLALRIFAKVSRARPLWWDDAAMICAWLLQFAAACCAQRAADLGLGLGRDRLNLHPGRVYQLATLALVYPNLETIVVGTARVSFALALLRLRRDRWWRLAIWIIVAGLVGVTMFALVLVRLTQCIPLQKLQYGEMEGTCRGDGRAVLYVGWASGAWSAFSDFALIAMSWVVVWSVRKMRTREKVGTGLAMSIGVVSGGITIFRYAWISPGFMADFYGKQVSHPFLRDTNTDLSSEYGWFGWILMSAEGMSSLIAASIPALRAFLLGMRADFRARFHAPLTYFQRTWGQSGTTLRREDSATGESEAGRCPGIKVERDFVVCHDATPPRVDRHNRVSRLEKGYLHCE